MLKHILVLALPFAPGGDSSGQSTPTREQVIAWCAPIPTLEQSLNPQPPDSAAIYARKLTPDQDQRYTELLAEVDRHMRPSALADKALPVAQQALELQVQALGRDHPDAVNTRKLVEMLQRMTELSVEDRQRVVAARELYDDAAARAAAGRAAEAIEAVDSVLETRTRLLGPGSVEVARALHMRADSLRAIGRYTESDESFRRALALMRTEIGLSHPHSAMALNNYARLLMETGEFQAAEQLFLAALSQFRQTVGDDDRRVLMVWNNVSQLLSTLGDPRSLAIGRRLVDGARALDGGSGVRYSMALSTLAVDLFRHGYFAEAEARMREALDVARRVDSAHPRVGQMAKNLADCLLARGELAEAEEVIEAATGRVVEAVGERSALSVRLLVLKARIQLLQEDPPGAEVTARQALGLLRAEQREDGPQAAEALDLLARVRSAQGDLQEAEAVSRQALQIRERAFGRDHLEVAHSLRDLGIVLSQRSDRSADEEAASCLRRAVEIAAQSAHADYPTAAIALADFHRARGRSAEALILYEEAHQQIERIRAQSAFDPLTQAQATDALWKWDPYGGMIRAQLAAGPGPAGGSDGAGPSAARAFDWLERSRGRALLDLLNSGSSLLAAVRQRAMTDNDASLRRAAEAIEQQAHAARNKRLAAERQSQAVRRDPRAAESITPPTDSAASERAAQDDMLALARSSLRLTPFTSERIAALLQPGEIVLAYDVGARDSLVFLLRRNGEATSQALSWPDGAPVTQGALRKRVQEALAQDSHPSPAEQALSRADDLFAALLPQSIRQEVLAAQRVFVLPDGPLHGFPLEMLPVDGKLWIDIGPPLAYGPSATVVLNRRAKDHSRPAGSFQFLALTDPDLDITKLTPNSAAPTSQAAGLERSDSQRPGDVRGDRRAVSLDPLPGARAEVAAIAARVRSRSGRDSSARVLQGEDASAPLLWNSLDHPRFLHLATHALVEDGPRVRTGALLLAPSEGDASGASLLRLDDLLRDWGGKLDGTELVVLSACRSGRGRLHAGEGFVGLTWGFLFAGADSIVASLWKADDAATVLLMDRFYANLLGPASAATAGQTPAAPLRKAEALCEAKRWLRAGTPTQNRERLRALGLDLAHADWLAARERGGRLPSSAPQPAPDPYDFSHPRFWAAFVLIGSPD